MCQFGRVKVFAWYVSRLVANVVKQKYYITMLSKSYCIIYILMDNERFFW